MQTHLDSFGQTRKYDNIMSAATCATKDMLIVTPEDAPCGPVRWRRNNSPAALKTGRKCVAVELSKEYAA